MRITRLLFIFGMLFFVVSVSAGCGSTPDTPTSIQSTSPKLEDNLVPEFITSTEAEKEADIKKELEPPLQETTTTPVTSASTPAPANTSSPVTTTEPLNETTTVTTPAPTSSTTSTPNPATTSTSPPASTTTPSDTNMSHQVSDFVAIPFSEIKAASLPYERINASPNAENQLTPGTILLYKTNEDRYGKLYVLENGNIFKFRWMTFTADGGICSQGEKLSVNLNSFCDLDVGSILGTSRDFQYQQTNEQERYLVSQGGAKYAIYGQEPDTEPPDAEPDVNQKIEYLLKKGNVQGSYLTFENQLTAGDTITGALQINVSYNGLYTWYFQIVDSNGTIERSWKGCNDPLACQYNIDLSYSYSVKSTGLYKIRILNYSSYTYRIFINLTPSGWDYPEIGTSANAWKIIK